MQKTTTKSFKNLVFSSLLFFAQEWEAKAKNLITNPLIPDSSQLDTTAISGDLMELELNEVIVTSPFLHYLPQQSGTQIYAGKKNEIIQLKNLNANLAANTTRQVFSRIPGVTVWENDASGVQVNVSTRGLTPNRSWEINVRQNGYDIVPDIYGYPEAYYTPPPQAVDQIQYIRGAASLQYGQQFGGMLNYIIKKAPKDKKFSYETQNSIGSNWLFNSYNAIGGTVKKFSYHGHYEFRRGDGQRDNNSFLIQNSYVNLGYAVSKKVQLSAEMTYFNYKLQHPSGLNDSMFYEDPNHSVRKRNWFGTPWWMWSANLHARPSEKVVIDWKVYGLRGQRNSVGVYTTPNIPDSINPVTLQYSNRQVDRDSYLNFATEFRSLTNYKLFKQEHAISAGMRLYHGWTNRQQLGKGTTGEDFDISLVNDSFPRDLVYKTNSIALFAENLFHITKDFSITPGIRYEYIHLTTDGRTNIINGQPLPYAPDRTKIRHIVLAGVGLNYKLPHSSELYFNFTQSYKPLYFAELTPVATTLVIDQDMKDAKGYNIDFGYRGTVKDFLSYDIGGFYLYYGNRAGTITKYLNDDPNQETYLFRTDVGGTRSTGAEVFVEFNPVKAFTENEKFGTLSLFASIGYTNAKYKDFPVDTAIGIAPNKTLVRSNLKGNFVEYAPQHNDRFGITYNIKGFSTTFQVSYTSSFFTNALNTETPNAGGTIGKIDGYTVVDWAFTYRFLEKFNVKAGINNLTNKRYITRRSGGYPGPGILPAEGINWFISAGIKI